MEPKDHFDLIVLGTGAAGSSGWELATRMGKRVAVFEGGVLGGECPTSACVPSKALLQCAEVYETVLRAREFGIKTGDVSFNYLRIKERKDIVVSRTGAARGEAPYHEAGVTLIRKPARFVSPEAVEADGLRYSADRFLIATGTSVRIPEIEGLATAGFLTFKEAIDVIRLPESLFILGGGPVGCEFAQLFTTFGVKVTMADRNEHLLAREDPEVGEFITERFRRRGVQVYTKATVVSVGCDDGKIVRLEQNGTLDTIAVEEILIATGKAPNLDLGLKKAGVRYGNKGITVDETLRTTNPKIYAAGDVVGPYLFTHAASYQGWLAVHNAFSDDQRRIDYHAMPRCVFTSPEVAAVGFTEAQARAKGRAVRVGKTGIESLGRANTSEQFEGFVKVVADSHGKLLGATVVAPRAGEILHELALGVSLGATARQVSSMIHAFPTFSEAVQMACAQI